MLFRSLSACGGGGGSDTPPGPLSGTYEGTLKVTLDTCKVGTPTLPTTYVVEQFNDSVILTTSDYKSELSGDSFMDSYLEVEGGDSNEKCNTHIKIYLTNITATSAHAQYNVANQHGCFPGHEEPLCPLVYEGTLKRKP